MLVISHGHLSLLTSGVGNGELTTLGLRAVLVPVLGHRSAGHARPVTPDGGDLLGPGRHPVPCPGGGCPGGAGPASPVTVLQAWASLVFLAVFGTVVGFLWYYQAIKEIGAVRSGVFINFVPIFAMLFGLLFLGEPLTSTLLQGGALVITGAWITNNNGLVAKSSSGSRFLGRRVNRARRRKSCAGCFFV